MHRAQKVLSNNRLPNGKLAAFVVSHKMPRHVHCSLPLRITNKSLEKLQDFFFKTKSTNIIVQDQDQDFIDPRRTGPRQRLSFLSSRLEAPRDQDPGLED